MFRAEDQSRVLDQNLADRQAAALEFPAPGPAPQQMPSPTTRRMRQPSRPTRMSMFRPGLRRQPTLQGGVPLSASNRQPPTSQNGGFIPPGTVPSGGLPLPSTIPGRSIPSDGGGFIPPGTVTANDMQKPGGVSAITNPYGGINPGGAVLSPATPDQRTLDLRRDPNRY
jgi:hypothetical protein